MAHNHHKSCCAQPLPKGVQQTLEEMDFERGPWLLAMHGDLDGLRKQLTKDSTCANKVDRSGYTPLHYSCRAGQLLTTELLINSFADVNASLHSGDTPLHRAAYMGHDHIVKLLLAHNANPAIKGADGQTPLHKAVQMTHLAVAQTLISYNKALVTVKDANGMLPIEHLPLSDESITCWQKLFIIDKTDQ